MIINCTPHAVKVGDTTICPSGIIPRVSTIEMEATSIDGFLTVTQSKGKVENLPAPKAGVFVLVSGMVFQASDRSDLIAPDTGKTAIRNDKGQIIAVTRLIRKGGEEE